MSMIAVHGPITWGDDTDQANDPIAMARFATAAGLANDATARSSATAATAITAIATGEALAPTRVTAY